MNSRLERVQIAQAMARVGVKSYLYYSTYIDPGKRSRLGAHHGEELFFLNDSFPTDWKHTDTDQTLGELMRRYWAQFAQTGDPNLDDLPRWPNYNSKSSDYFELGEHIGPHPLAARIRSLETIMRHVVDQQARN
jgi:para-nitrobenzyl esterase